MEPNGVYPMIYILPILFLVCGSICYSLAKEKNRNKAFWVVMGSFFGPLAIPFIYFAKSQPAV